jgi:sugar/nucleoside kinase (ribokinase family)
MTDASSLVCIGNLTIDEAVSAAGERVESVGGDALFAALAARLVGGNPTILAPLGNDATPALLTAISSAGTDPAALPRRELPTVRNVIRYDEAGGRVWDLVLGDEHFEELSVHPGDVSDGVLAAPGVLLCAMALHAQLELAAWLRARTAAIIYFDPQEDYIAGHEAALLDAVRACDVFLPSEIEATALAGTSELAAAAAAFLELGPRVVVIKLAAAGCLVATAERPEPTVVPTDAVEPVDSTGAGDAFCGAFAAEHLRCGDPYAAAAAGAAAARTAVGAPGIGGLLAAVANSAGVAR